MLGFLSRALKRPIFSFMEIGKVSINSNFGDISPFEAKIIKPQNPADDPSLPFAQAKRFAEIMAKNQTARTYGVNLPKNDPAGNYLKYLALKEKNIAVSNLDQIIRQAQDLKPGARPDYKALQTQWENFKSGRPVVTPVIEIKTEPCHNEELSLRRACSTAFRLAQDSDLHRAEVKLSGGSTLEKAALQVALTSYGFKNTVTAPSDKAADRTGDQETHHNKLSALWNRLFWRPAEPEAVQTNAPKQAPNKSPRPDFENYHVEIVYHDKDPRDLYPDTFPEINAEAGDSRLWSTSRGAKLAYS